MKENKYRQAMDNISDYVIFIVGQDIVEFNIRYASCPGCGGRCKCSTTCSVGYWPSIFAISHDTLNYKNHPRQELATKGLEEHKQIRKKVIEELRGTKG